MLKSEDDATSGRKQPNILITGTPGTGKTTHAEMLAQESNGSLKAINVGDFVKEHGCHEGWDDEWQSWLVDDEKVGSITFLQSLSSKSHRTFFLLCPDLCVI